MIEKAVIYNNTESTGICPEHLFLTKKLPDGVRANVELTRVQMKELFNLRDRDHVEHTDKFGEKVRGYLHEKLLEGVSNDKVLPFNEDNVSTKDQTLNLPKS